MAVIKRFGTEVIDGFIKHDDRHSSFDEAERIAGRRLDRRKSYAIINGEVCESCTFTAECSGCDGGGCFECGYKGKRVQSHWIPLCV